MSTTGVRRGEVGHDCEEGEVAVLHEGLDGAVECLFLFLFGVGGFLGGFGGEKRKRFDDRADSEDGGGVCFGGPLLVVFSEDVVEVEEVDVLLGGLQAVVELRAIPGRPSSFLCGGQDFGFEVLNGLSISGFGFPFGT